MARRRPNGKQPTSPGEASSPAHLSPATSSRGPLLDANGRASLSGSLVASGPPHAVPGVPPPIREQPSVKNEAAYSSARSSLSPQSSLAASSLGDPGASLQPASQPQDCNMEAALAPAPSCGSDSPAYAYKAGLPPQPTARPIASASPFATAAALGSFGSLDGDKHSDVSSTEGHESAHSAASHSSARRSCNSLASLRCAVSELLCSFALAGALPFACTCLRHNMYDKSTLYLLSALLFDGRSSYVGTLAAKSTSSSSSNSSNAH